MVTCLYTANIKINKSVGDYIKYLVAINDNGVLIMDKGLFVLSFDTEKDFKEQVDIEGNNLNHIGDITLWTFGKFNKTFFTRYIFNSCS